MQTLLLSGGVESFATVGPSFANPAFEGIDGRYPSIPKHSFLTPKVPPTFADVPRMEATPCTPIN
jgi:hypothetical protein